jgi:hypothetical protein
VPEPGLTVVSGDWLELTPRAIVVRGKGLVVAFHEHLEGPTRLMAQLPLGTIWRPIPWVSHQRRTARCDRPASEAAPLTEIASAALNGTKTLLPISIVSLSNLSSRLAFASRSPAIRSGMEHLSVSVAVGMSVWRAVASGGRQTTYPLIERRSKAPQQRYSGLAFLGADCGLPAYVSRL